MGTHSLDVDTIDAFKIACETIAIAVDELDARGPLSPRDRIAAWHHLATVIDQAKVVLGQLAHDAVEAMAQLDLREIETDIGPVHVAKGSRRTEWRGHSVCGVLARPLIDRELGEVVDAIPLDVVRECFGGCDDPAKTSANLLVGGLAKNGVRVDDFRTVSDAPLVIKPGPLPEALRPKRRRKTQGD